jgi:hypothetical protein
MPIKLEKQPENWGRYLKDLACQSSHAFGGGFCEYLTDLALGIWVSSHEFSMPFSGDEGLLSEGLFWYAG